MKYLLALVTTVSMPAFAADLSTSDMTGITFWLVTAAMLAATVFFFAERDVVKGKWENFAISSWFSYWCCVLALSIYERCMG